MQAAARAGRRSGLAPQVRSIRQPTTIGMVWGSTASKNRSSLSEDRRPPGAASAGETDDLRLMPTGVRGKRHLYAGLRLFAMDVSERDDALL